MKKKKKKKIWAQADDMTLKTLTGLLGHGPPNQLETETETTLFLFLKEKLRLPKKASLWKNTTPFHING